MGIKYALESLAEELQEMRRLGKKTVVVSPESLELLRQTVTSSIRQQEAVSIQGGGFVRPTTEEVRLPDWDSRKEEKKAPAKKKATVFTLAPLPADPPEVKIAPGDAATAWNALRDQVLNCPVCQAQVRPGKKVVFGVGNPEADIFFVGEAPGAEEEIQGEPFVGPAGELLTKMIKAMGLSREKVYIGNIMNWRPAMPSPVGNRPPSPEEMRFCLPYLQAQIDIVRPKVLIALGNTAVSGLLGHDPKRRLSAIRGQWFSFADRPLMVTFHPSYLLRNNSNLTKRMVWEDLLAVMEKTGLPISERQKGFFL